MSAARRLLYFGFVLMALLSFSCWWFLRIDHVKQKIESPSIPKYLPFTDSENICLENGFTLSREYQMKLQKPLFKYRTQAFNHILPKIANTFNLPALAEKQNWNSSIRYQYLLNTTTCGKSFNPRVRKYQTIGHPPTIDIKTKTKGNEAETNILKVLWQPGLLYDEHSIKKCEREIHPCKTSFSQETRVILTGTKLKTCGDLFDVFPVMQSIAGKSVRGNYLSDSISEYNAWWFELEHRGVLWDGETNFKISIGFMYQNEEDAASGHGNIYLIDPEWSFRIWSSRNGKGKWKTSVLDRVDACYYNAIQVLDSIEVPCIVK